MPYPKKRKRPNSSEDIDKNKKRAKGLDQDPMLRSALRSTKSGLRTTSSSFKTNPRGKRPPPLPNTGTSGQGKARGRFRDSVTSNRGKPQHVASGPFGKQASRATRIKDIHSEEFICNAFPVPRAQDYGLDVEPVDDPSSLLLAANLDSVTQSSQESALVTRLVERVELKLELGDESMLLLSFGHGRTREEAERNAHLHAIVQLHDKGLLKEILPGGKFFLARQPNTQDTTARKDIIDYAARHDCLPIFTSSIGRSKLKRKLVTAQVTIEEMGLIGLGRQSTVDGALQQACLSLKAAAEARHEKDGDGTLLVKDFTKLTSASARQFVDYYCHIHKTYSTVATQSKNLPRMASQWATTIAIQSKAPLSVEDTNGAATMTFEGIPMKLKKDSEDTGYLAAALALKRQSPDTWISFVKEIRRGNGEVLKSVRPIDLNLDSTTIRALRNSTQEIEQVASTIQFDLEGESNNSKQSRYYNARKVMTPDMIDERNHLLKQRLEDYEKSEINAILRQKRSELPMVQYKGDLLAMINDNDVCVVVGATGSGKTTQLPQLLLEEMTRQDRGAVCNIICTQPRRIAAISVAQRVAVERAEALQESVGYAVRFDSKPPRFGGSINYCTTGILLRQLQEGQDAVLEGLSHIIVDEVHERDVQIDFLLILLRRMLSERKSQGKPTIKVILMSATIDTNLFCKYFGEGLADKQCPSISIPGRTFPVTTHHLDEIDATLRSKYDRRSAPELFLRDTSSYLSKELAKDLALTAPPTENNSDADDEEKAIINWQAKGLVGEDGELELAQEKEDTATPIELMSVIIAHLLKTTDEGSLLVFLPGLQEITALNRHLTSNKPLGLDLVNDPAYKVYMLHSAIPQMQQEVFEHLGPGQRKIILSTNIAETSITIPDVVYVIDSGKVRESQYDQAKRISSLVSTWTSKSSAKQRAGRAGRVQNGHYYALTSEARYESLDVTALPEMLRTDLQELCLQIKSMGIANIRQFLVQAVQPPASSSVDSAIEHLQSLRALDENENLTPLGKMLSTFPVQPSLGKMVILAAIFRCLDPIIILAAAATGKDPFLSPAERRSEAERVRLKWAEGSGSDHIALLNAFKAWRATRASGGKDDRAFAFENFLHYNSLVSIAQTGDQIIELLQKAGIVQPDSKKKQRYRARYGTEDENEHSDSRTLLTALLTAGFFPNVAVQTPAGRALRTAHENAAQIHINSLAAPKVAGNNRYGPLDRDALAPPGTLYTFAQKTQADQSTIMLRTISKTSPLSVILFGGSTSAEGPVLKVDDWIPFYLRGPQRQVVQQLGSQLDKYLEITFARLGAINQSKLLNQSSQTAGFLDQDPVRQPLVTAVVEALEANDRQIQSTSRPSPLDRRSYTSRPSSRTTLRTNPEITKQFEALFHPSTAAKDERRLFG